MPEMPSASPTLIPTTTAASTVTQKTDLGTTVVFRTPAPTASSTASSTTSSPGFFGTVVLCLPIAVYMACPFCRHGGRRSESLYLDGYRRRSPSSHSNLHHCLLRFLLQAKVTKTNKNLLAKVQFLSIQSKGKETPTNVRSLYEGVPQRSVICGKKGTLAAERWQTNSLIDW